MTIFASLITSGILILMAVSCLVISESGLTHNTAFFRYSECEIPLCIPALLPVSTCEKAQSDFPDKPHRNFHYLKISHKYYG